MHASCGFVVIVLVSAVAGAEPDADRAKKQLKSDNYTVTWGTAKDFDANAELEIGDGDGHGGKLGWVRFLPGRDGVDVLSIQFDEGWEPYKSKWPPDRAPVIIKRARMKSDAYATLLRDLAVIDAAKLEPIKGNSFSSTHDFWVYARLTVNKKALVGLDWAGYEGSSEELNFAKPRAVVTLAREAVKRLDFKAHTLTGTERAWASAKFARDWEKFKGLESHWWVRERYIITIGVVGDATAFPTLRDILGGDPKDRDVYYAINAVTRLTKTDVRDKPVEEMDVEKTRRKVLDLIRDEK
jgi:hypothetical protein